MARADERYPDLRASDAVASELGQHFQDGRLDQAEFDERVGAAIAAKTHRDLDSLLADLPHGSAGQPSVGISESRHIMTPGPGAWHPAQPRVRRGRPAFVAVLPLLLAVAIIAGLSSGGWQHAWPFAPFGFLWLIVPILVVRTWIRGGRRRQWR
jgi:hypothetical protein